MNTIYNKGCLILLDNKVVSLTIADIHIGKKDTEMLRKELNQYFIESLEDLKGTIDIITIAGDYFDRIIRFNEPAGILAIDIMEYLIKYCKDNNTQLRILQGTRSHDNNQLDVFGNYEKDFPNFFKIIRKVNTEKIVLGGKERNILYLPEEYPSNPDDYYKEYFDKEEGYYDLIFGHGMTDVVGFDFSNWGDDSENISLGTPVHNTDNLIKLSKGPVIFGHIHNMKSYKDKFFYTGSFSRYAFDSQEEKGFLLAYLNSEDFNDFEVGFIENEDAPTYGIINIDNINLKEGEDLFKIIETMTNQFTYSKIISSDENNLKLMRQLSEKESSIKIETKKKENKSVIDDKYSFILENNLSTEETIQKYIKLGESEKEIPLGQISMIISEKDYSFDDILNYEKSEINKI